MKCKILAVAVLTALALYVKPRGSDPKENIFANKGKRMKNKTIATMALLALTALSCFLFTTCNFPVVDDTDNLPLEEWVVSKVEYHPNFRVPYVEVSNPEGQTPKNIFTRIRGNE